MATVSTYRDAGVDLEKADSIVQLIKAMSSPAIGKSIGAFSGAYELEVDAYQNPVILTATDGVGTKILVAEALDRYDTLGIDLVAMCVNDLLASGAKPLLFLDYVACGKLEGNTFRQLMSGIVKGCEIARCTLSGGETAELPDMYTKKAFDLAGFAVGIANKDQILPKSDLLEEGDTVLGLPSSGIHSNGLSLARKVIPQREPGLWEELLRPTKIYTDEMSVLFESAKILSAAHITGGGLLGNLVRVTPPHLVPRFNHEWFVPSIFNEIQARGNIAEEEMNRIFNMGIGMALIVKKESEPEIRQLALKENIKVVKIGQLQNRTSKPGGTP